MLWNHASREPDFVDPTEERWPRGDRSGSADFRRHSLQDSFDNLPHCDSLVSSWPGEIANAGRSATWRHEL